MIESRNNSVIEYLINIIERNNSARLSAVRKEDSLISDKREGHAVI